MQVLSPSKYIILEFNTNTKGIWIYSEGTKKGFKKKVAHNDQLWKPIPIFSKPVSEEESLIPQKFGIPWKSTSQNFDLIHYYTIFILEIHYGDGWIAILEKMKLIRVILNAVGSQNAKMIPGERFFIIDIRTNLVGPTWTPGDLC